VLTVLGCLAPVALTACTGGGSNLPSTPPTASAEPASAVNPQPRTMLADGGELRLPVAAIGHQWNPLYSDSSDGSDSSGGSDSSDSDSDADVALMMGPMLPRLFNYDADGNPSPNPDYLAGVDASGGNPQVVTYTLSPNAVWNSGRAMSADDFIAEWQACNGQNVSFKCNATSKFSQVSAVKQGNGPSQVVVTYKGSYADWPSTFDVLLPKESDSDPATFNDGWTSLTKIHDWLAGPFEVSAVSRDDGVLIETPNPQWWADKPKLSQLTFRVIAADERLAALRDHQIDAYDLGSDPGAIKDVDTLPGCEIREADVPHGKPQITATRRTLANYGSFGQQSIVWTDVGYLQPAT
jgi:peptide/nickel transport system substrate-binding protein